MEPRRGIGEPSMADIAPRWRDGSGRPPPSASAIDPTKASIARVYDASLGGKDNYESDRQVLGKVLEIAPHQPETSLANRRWLSRVVSYLVTERRIDQFLDVGSGLPTQENTHQVAHRHNPDAVVVYVDNDPVCSAHGRALLEDDRNSHFLSGDLRHPSELLDSPDLREWLDLSRPICLLQCGTLHHTSDDEDPWGIMREYVDLIAPGSYVALSHFWNPMDGGELQTLAESIERRILESSMGTGRYRTTDKVVSMMAGLELLPPGMVEVGDWWPDGPRLTGPWPEERLLLSGVGRKP